MINALFFGQDVSKFELAGISLGITSTLLICLWDDVTQHCCEGREKKVNEDDEFKA